MGILATLAAGGLFKGLGSAALGGLTSLFGSMGQNSAQRRMMQEQMQFNADEAAKNRAWQQQMNQENNMFSARQAELARQFQEDFYNKYQSPAAMMAQYQDAGINPMLIAGQGAGSPPSVSSASAGSSPGGSAASAGLGSAAPLSLVDAITSFMKIKAEIDNINADTEEKKAGAGLKNAQIPLTAGQVQKLQADINLTKEQVKSEKAKAALYAADAVLKKDEHLFFDRKKEQFDLQNFLLKWEKEYIRKYKHKPDQNTLNILLDKIKPFTDVGEIVIDDLGNVGKKGYGLLKSIFGF